MLIIVGITIENLLLIVNVSHFDIIKEVLPYVIVEQRQV
jgi:hypothetical protein